MAQIIPIRDLKDTTNIYEMAKNTNEPIYVTKNGYGALVIMNIDAYERIFAAVELRNKLKEAEDELNAGAELLDGNNVLKELRYKYGK